MTTIKIWPERCDDCLLEMFWQDCPCACDYKAEADEVVTLLQYEFGDWGGSH